MEIVAGGSATDTIGAYLAVPLVIVVRDSTGKPAYDSPVTFTVLPIPGAPANPLPAAPALVSPTSYVYDFGPQTAMKEWTDSFGRTAVTVQLGTVAAQVRIAIDGNVLPVHDTVTYTVLPGTAVRLDVQPSDTALYVGNRYQLHARSLDRAGNVRPDRARIAGGDSVLARDAELGVTGHRYGRDFTDVETTTHRVRVWASVVPKGTIAVTIANYATDYGVGVVNLDGSGRRRIFGPGAYPHTARSPRWSPDGKWLAALERGRVYLVDVATGMGREATPDWNPTWEESWPTFSPDGRWIYFTVGSSVDNHYTLWRVRVDSGGAPEQLPIAMQYTRHQADVSPDGAHVVYVGGDAYLHEFALADSTDRTLTAAHGLVNRPRSAPDGGMIAYLLSANFPNFDPASGVYLLPVRGTTAQRITPPVNTDSAYSWTYAGGNSWSPDGEWIISSTLGRLQVINVKTGLTIPLPWSEDYTDPDWKP